MQKPARKDAESNGEARRPRGRPRLEDVAAIEGRLLEVALREFVKHGYGATSMARIVKAAGISKTTLYSRFSSKGDLFRAIMQRQIDRIGGASALQASGRPDLEKGLKAYASRMLELSLTGGLLEVNRLIYSESTRFPELGAAATERTQVGIQQVADFIQACADADNLPCRDPRGVAEAFIILLRGWYVDVMLTNRKVPEALRERWVESAVRILLVGRKDW